VVTTAMDRVKHNRGRTLFGIIRICDRIEIRKDNNFDDVTPATALSFYDPYDVLHHELLRLLSDADALSNVPCSETFS